jgi:hypothetical protein
MDSPRWPASTCTGRAARDAAAARSPGPVVVLLLQQDPSAAVRATAAWLLGPSGGPGAGLAIAAAALTLAAWAAPRVTAGLAGWPRHLPVSEATHRRAALAALVTAQAPLLVALLLLAPVAARQAGGVAPARLVVLPLIAAAAAVAAWPGERAWRSRPLALLALLLLAQPGPTSLLAALLLLAVADRPPACSARAHEPPPASFPPTPVLISSGLGVAFEASPSSPSCRSAR